MNGNHPIPSRDIESAFDEAMMAVYTRALAECGYKATRFLRMLNERRGLETARTLLRAPSVSEGYVALWERKRLDLAVESVILDRQWEALFSEEERATARRRLADLWLRSADPCPRTFMMASPLNKTAPPASSTTGNGQAKTARFNDGFKDIKKLEMDLWEAADNLRANSKLTSSDYFMPVLGVIFLRHAANRFEAAHQQIAADRASGKMPKRKILPADYIARRSLYLPEAARCDEIMQQAAVSGKDPVPIPTSKRHLTTSTASYGRRVPTRLPRGHSSQVETAR